MIFNIAIALALLIIVFLALREVLLFRQKRDPLGLRRLTLRLSTSFMLIFLLCSLFIGIRVFQLKDFEGIIQLWIAFWTSIVLITGGVFCMLIADFRQQSETATLKKDDFVMEIARIIAEHQAKPPEE